MKIVAKHSLFRNCIQPSFKKKLFVLKGYISEFWSFLTKWKIFVLSLLSTHMFQATCFSDQVSLLKLTHSESKSTKISTLPQTVWKKNVTFKFLVFNMINDVIHLVGRGDLPKGDFTP